MEILLADRRSRVRYALRVLLQQQPGWRVVGEAGDSVEMHDQAQALYPDLVLVDLDLPGLEGTDWLPRLRRSCPGVRVVALSEQLEEAPEGSAWVTDAYASKVNPPERLLAVIRSLAGLRPGDRLADAAV